MEDLVKLEVLSLISKVTSELQNYLGTSDKTLSEFLIAQRLETKSGDDFRQRLDGIGADLPPAWSAASTVWCWPCIPSSSPRPLAPKSTARRPVSRKRKRSLAASRFLTARLGPPATPMP